MQVERVTAALKEEAALRRQLGEQLQNMEHQGMSGDQKMQVLQLQKEYDQVVAALQAQEEETAQLARQFQDEREQMDQRLAQEAQFRVDAERKLEAASAELEALRAELIEKNQALEQSHNKQEQRVEQQDIHAALANRQRSEQLEFELKGLHTVSEQRVLSSDNLAVLR